MSREKELVKNTVILALGRFLPKIVAIVTLPIVTAQLTKAEYGTYDLISTLVMLVLPIATLQIQSAAFRFLIDCRGNKEKSGQIITNIFVVTLPISIAVSIAVAFFWRELSAGTRILISVYLLVDILYLTVAQIVRGLSHNKEYSISSIVLSGINAFFIVITLQIRSDGLDGAVFSLIIANVSAVLYLLARIGIWNYIRPRYISWARVKEMVSYSWPMIPNNLSSWVLKLSDRLVITAVLGVEANAVYAVANKIPNLLSMAQSVFVMAWQENASIAVGDKDADKYYTKMFDQIFSLVAGLTAVLIGFTPVMFALLIRGDYADAYVQIPLLILAMFFYCMSAFQGGIYIAHKRTKSVGITTMVAAAVNFLIDILFVRVIGITAGSLSTLIAYLLLYVYRMIDSKKFQKMDYNIKKQILLLFIIVIMLIMCFMQRFWVNVVNIVFGIAMCLILNKNMLLTIAKKIKK